MEPTEEVDDSPTGWVAEHIRRYVESDGKQGHRFYGNDTLLLITRGRRSGKLRRTALIYGRHGDAYVVVGSNGGAAEHPLWYLNLLADSLVYVQVGSLSFTAQARAATAEERPRLWAMMTGLFRQYASYQKKTKRQIPVVVLDPSTSPDQDRPASPGVPAGEQQAQRAGGTVPQRGGFDPVPRE